MPIAFGNELNSSIDRDEVLDPQRGADGGWFLEVRRPTARVKNRARRRGSTSLIASSKTWRRGSMQPGSRRRQARRRSSYLVSVCVEFAHLDLLQCGDARLVHRG